MSVEISNKIAELVIYGVETGITDPREKHYSVNLLLDVMKEEDFAPDAEVREALDEAKQTLGGISSIFLEEVLGRLLDEAAKKELLENDSVVYRDLFDTKLMNCLLPRPAAVQEQFENLKKESVQAATDWFYKFSCDSDYIRRYRIEKDIRWSVPSSYGDIEISINLSKPEKDPKAIAAAGRSASVAYPKCQLCVENEGYAGRNNHPARQSLRIMPITIKGDGWGFQYSPYVYYNEHCIVLNGKHEPMKIERKTFEKLFDFVEQFPHYFLGSNADLPIVGGSILSHDHYQGGHHTFPMAKAEMEETFVVAGYEDVTLGILNWPLSVIRLRASSKERIIELADHILCKWRSYTDEAANILAETDGEAHNTITPIARKNGDLFELDLALRNNLTTEEYPMGVYHPHEQYHHIKKENIGLIEVMGLAILPARLKTEMELLAGALVRGEDYRTEESLKKHADWADGVKKKYPELNADNVEDILKEEVGAVFVGVLEDAGVYKCDVEGRKAFRRFIETL